MSNHVRVAHWLCVLRRAPTDTATYRCVRVIEQTCVPISERMRGTTQAEFLRDGLQLPGSSCRGAGDDLPYSNRTVNVGSFVR